MSSGKAIYKAGNHTFARKMPARASQGQDSTLKTRPAIRGCEGRGDLAYSTKLEEYFNETRRCYVLMEFPKCSPIPVFLIEAKKMALTSPASE